jgi:hypothetical protein
LNEHGNQNTYKKAKDGIVGQADKGLGKIHPKEFERTRDQLDAQKKPVKRRNEDQYP